MIQTTLATPADFAAILALQERNHLSNLAENARGDGFLTTYLEAYDLQTLCAQGTLFVAKSDGELAGFAGAKDWDLSGEHAWYRAVLALFPLPFEGFQITAQNSFQYGPACVAAPFRGQNVLGSLIEAVKAAFRPRCECGVTFIDARNARSLAAHGRKLGFATLAELPFGELRFGRTIYHVLGFSTRSSL